MVIKLHSDKQHYVLVVVVVAAETAERKTLKQLAEVELEYTKVSVQEVVVVELEYTMV